MLALARRARTLDIGLISAAEYSLRFDKSTAVFYFQMTSDE
jgi:hypothetical protein